MYPVSSLDNFTGLLLIAERIELRGFLKFYMLLPNSKNVPSFKNLTFLFNVWTEFFGEPIWLRMMSRYQMMTTHKCEPIDWLLSDKTSSVVRA